MNLRVNFLLLVFVYAFALLAQNNEQLNYTDQKGLKQGFWRKTNELGQVKYEGHFKDGKPTGHFTYFYNGGQKKAESDYTKNGTLARTLLYHELGEKKASGNYLNEKKDSIWNFYDEKGRLTSTEDYKENKRHGKSIIYYPSGKIIGKGFMEKGYRKEGTWKWFDEQGKEIPEPDDFKIKK
jgi:antitoxin component YwqK of YwqJK toxin-antitoxin module